jgi:5-methylcytosine-specific restriction endonuclease McrA
LNKTGKRCHICGGKIKKNEKWQADHVFPHIHGGKHSHENYLPSHSLCNRGRWHYSAEEFQWIIKLGAWTRTLIENNQLDVTLIEKFIKKEQRKISRQKGNSGKAKR